MNELQNKTEESPRIFVKKLVFNDGKEMPIGHSEIVIFTGANNAGKSQVLKDLDSLGRNSGMKGIVLSSLVTEFYGDIALKAQDFQQKDGRFKVMNSIFTQIDDLKNVWNGRKENKRGRSYTLADKTAILADVTVGNDSLVGLYCRIRPTFLLQGKSIISIFVTIFRLKRK